MNTITTADHAVLDLISRRQLDYAAAVDTLSPQYGRSAVEGVIFELVHQGRILVKEGVLRPSRRRADAQKFMPWEYRTVEAPLLAQLVDKLNNLGGEGWEVVTVSQETIGTLTPKRHVALLKRQRNQ